MILKKYYTNVLKIIGRYHWWQTTLFIIGIIALLSVISALFFPTGSVPKKFYTNSPVPEVGSADFATALAHSVNVPLEQGGTIEVLNNGDGFYPSLINVFDQAKKTINFSVYIWTEGEASSKLLQTLIKKQKEGVQVRVLLDAFGSKEAPEELFNELKEIGGKVEQYRPASYGKLTRYHRRNHRRSIVIDGQVGFIGGMAVSDSWLGNAQDPKHWRDVMFKVTGPMARSVQDAFVDHWASSSGEILVGQDIYPSSFSSDQNTSTHYIHIAGSPVDDSQPIPKFLLLPMLAAKEKIHIVNPYFIADRNLMDVLIDKAKNGVDVKLLVPGENIDNKIVRWSAQSQYQELLESGVKIYEYQPTFIHSKFFIVDDFLSVIGSPNLNSRSRRLDEENAMAVFDRNLAEQLSRLHDEDLKQSKEINLEEWRDRSYVLRLLQFISKSLNNQS